MKGQVEKYSGILIAEWKRLERKAIATRKEADEAYERADCFSKLPNKLRPVTECDLKVGAILWYKDPMVEEDENGEEFEYVRWDLVDAWPELGSGQYSSDGCYCSIDHAFVEVDPFEDVKREVGEQFNLLHWIDHTDMYWRFTPSGVEFGCTKEEVDSNMDYFGWGSVCNSRSVGGFILVVVERNGVNWISVFDEENKMEAIIAF